MDIDIQAVSATESFYSANAQWPTQRSERVHSGISPDLANKRQTLDDFLDLMPEAKPVLAPPMPGQSVDPVTQALLDGINDIKSNMITRSTLREFHQLQAEEMRTFVRAEMAPLHGAVGQLSDEMTDLKERVTKVEQNGGNPKAPRNARGVDDSFRKLAVVGFDPNVGLEERLAAMKTFMSRNFPKVDARYAVIHSGSWKDKGSQRKMSKVGLIDVGCPDLRELLMKSIDSKGLKVQCGGKELKVARAKSQSARGRDDALYQAADLLKKQANISDKDVSIKRGETRGVELKGAFVFTQPAGIDLGTFCGEFSHLKLP